MKKIIIKMTLWTYCLIFTLSAFGNSKQNSLQTLHKKPNILFLLADDLGYGELGCYGQKEILTPHLDQMAKDGIRFTQFYAGAPVCAPSRAVLMTGKKLSTNTIRGNYGLVDGKNIDRIALKMDEMTIAELVKKADYQTAFFGKWHLDYPYDLRTWARGRGFDYAVQEQWDAKIDKLNMFKPNIEYVNGMEKLIEFDYKKWNCKDELRTELALDYLKNKKSADRPFFLFMSFRAPHAREELIGNTTLYADKGWPEKERIHAAKITLLDQQVGRLLKHLEESGELDNTLVFFTSDNGPHIEGGHDHEFFQSNGVLTGHKRDVYEGGMRVPTMVYWKGKLNGGLVTDYMGSAQDFMPTIADIVGLEVPEQCNGVSFSPVLMGKEEPRYDYLNWEFHSMGKNPDHFRQAVRIGDLKALRYGVDSPIKIFDLAQDESEENDIADQHPELVKRVKDIFENDRTANSAFPYQK